MFLALMAFIFDANLKTKESKIAESPGMVVCVSTTLDPKNYRPDPALAKNSIDFLSVQESQISRGFADMLERAIRKKWQNNPSSFPILKTYSKTNELRYKVSNLCGSYGTYISITTKYIDNDKFWVIKINLSHGNYSRDFYYKGRDTYISGNGHYFQDQYGGIVKGLEQAIDHDLINAIQEELHD